MDLDAALAALTASATCSACGGPLTPYRAGEIPLWCNYCRGVNPPPESAEATVRGIFAEGHRRRK